MHALPQGWKSLNGAAPRRKSSFFAKASGPGRLPWPWPPYLGLASAQLRQMPCVQPAQSMTSVPKQKRQMQMRPEMPGTRFTGPQRSAAGGEAAEEEEEEDIPERARRLHGCRHDLVVEAGGD